MANKIVKLAEVTNGAEEAISFSEPYIVDVSIQGVADILLHRWNAEAVEEKSRAAKNSKAKKSDNVGSYVYRDEAGYICVPGEYVRQSIIGAAKFRSDPRSPRKSAQDLFKAGIVALTPLASLGVRTWDYEDRRRVVVQRNGVNRIRPALRTGWNFDMRFACGLPEYVDPALLREVVDLAGKLIGIGDFRPTYGRFVVTRFSVGLE